MAGDFELYTEKIQTFNNNYKVNFSFEKYEAEVYKWKTLRSAFNVKGQISAANAAYRKLIGDVYKESMESLMSNKLKSLNHEQFLADFEKLMDTYRGHAVAKDKDYPDKLGGWNGTSEVYGELEAKIRIGIKPNKAQHMKDKYLERGIRLRDMRADLEAYKKSTESTPEDLSQLMVYKEALQLAVNSRSGWWKANPLNWVRNNAEQRDLKALKTFLKEKAGTPHYVNAFDISVKDVVSPEIESLKKDKTESATKEKEEFTTRMLKENKAVNKVSGLQQVRELAQNKEFLETMKSQILGILGDKHAALGGMIWKTSLHDTPFSSAQSMWLDFEKAKSPEDKIKSMELNTKKVFNAAFSGMKMLNMDPKERVIAAQKISNLIIMQYSPAGADSQYAKYGNNYIVNDAPDAIQTAMYRENIPVASPDKFEAFVNDVREELASRSRMSIESESETSKTVAKSEMKKESPNLSKNSMYK